MSLCVLGIDLRNLDLAQVLPPSSIPSFHLREQRMHSLRTKPSIAVPQASFADDFAAQDFQVLTY